MKKIYAYMKYMDIIDYFLLLFMIILITQTIYNCFFNEAIGNKSAIDTALRTTSAGLFGYYIGKGFIGQDNPSEQDMDRSSKPYSLESLKELEVKPQVHTNTTNNLKERKIIQVIIVGSLGILALLILIIARNMFMVTNDNTASLSQLRDFVSGSTGFLMSQSRK